VRQVLRIYATGLWTGFFPFAPGTAGSLLGVAMWMYLPFLPLAPSASGFFGVGFGTIAFLAVLTLIGVVASRQAEEEFGEDGGPIVIDEVIGVWISVAGLAVTPFTVVAGFLLFRAFDIFKPFPAGRSQEWGGGWGVMMDDVFAGIYAAIVLRLMLAYLPLPGWLA
jgi:phosphatidylglycerophosphatase A